jgi:hypothetical protein
MKPRERSIPTLEAVTMVRPQPETAPRLPIGKIVEVSKGEARSTPPARRRAQSPETLYFRIWRVLEELRRATANDVAIIPRERLNWSLKKPGDRRVNEDSE